jgi:hypothetical protein
VPNDRNRTLEERVRHEAEKEGAMEIHELMTLGRDVFCLAIPGNFLVLHERLLGRLK